MDRNPVENVPKLPLDVNMSLKRLWLEAAGDVIVSVLLV